MLNMKSTAQARDLLVRAAENLADRHLAQLFDAPLNTQGSECLERQVATGVFSPGVTMLKAALQGLEQREGLLIQGATTLALQAVPGLIVLPTLRIPVTDADRKLVDGNRHADLSELAPPHAGDETGRVEVDLAVANRVTNSLLLIDVKRWVREKDKDISRLKEDGLAATRRLSREGLFCTSTTIILLRWYGEPITAFGSTVATPATVNDLLGAPVREAVEAALYRFKSGVEARTSALLARASGAMAPSDVDRPAQARVETPVANLEALRRVLSADRIGRRA